jgi:hypothetical protein
MHENLDVYEPSLARAHLVGRLLSILKPASRE